jgi:hypothetical protein
VQDAESLAVLGCFPFVGFEVTTEGTRAQTTTLKDQIVKNFRFEIERRSVDVHQSLTQLTLLRNGFNLPGDFLNALLQLVPFTLKRLRPFSIFLRGMRQSSRDHATCSRCEPTGTSPSARVRNTIDSCAPGLEHSMVMDWACNAGGVLIARKRFTVGHHLPNRHIEANLPAPVTLLPTWPAMPSILGINALGIGFSECPAMPASGSFSGLRKLSHSISARNLSRAIGMGPTALTCFGEQHCRPSKTLLALAPSRPQFAAPRH